MPTPSTMTKAEKADWQRRCDYAARRFSLQVEELASRAPFSVRVVVVGEIKRYVKEQS